MQLQGLDFEMKSVDKIAEGQKDEEDGAELTQSKSASNLTKRMSKELIKTSQTQANHSLFLRRQEAAYEAYEAESCLSEEVSGDVTNTAKRLISLEQLEGMVKNLKKRNQDLHEKSKTEKKFEELRSQSMRA